MRRLLVLTAALTFLLAACGDDATTGESPEGTLPDDVAVFGPDDIEADSYGEAVTWTPSADDVAAVEAILAEHLEANAATGVDELAAYARQYTGVGEGEDLVSVNALCSLGDMDWEDEYITVADGGPCFWQATVDPATAEVDPFTVNGSA
jgi:hypothetical protein